MRKSSIYLTILSVGILALALLLGVQPHEGAATFEADRSGRRQVVRRLMLTDLCLFTEARYTRHLSQADLFSAFQDHPVSLEHFPSGSLVRPPVFLWEKRHAMD